jgi:hypothetical protein
MKEDRRTCPSGHCILSFWTLYVVLLDIVCCPSGHCMLSFWTLYVVLLDIVYNVQMDNIQCPEGQQTMSRRTTYNVQKDNIQCPEGQHTMSRRKKTMVYKTLHRKLKK